MTSQFNSVALVGKINNPAIREHVLALARFLDGRGIGVVVEANTAHHLDVPGYPAVTLDQLGRYADLVIVLGGDGTMLMVAREIVNYGIPLVGVNKGRLGFLTDLTTETMLEVIGAMLNGDYTPEQRILLGASILRDGVVHSTFQALNDVVVSKGSAARLIDLELVIDTEFVHRQRSDGLIIATPTGTTAYALSAGGPLLHPTLDAVALVPICPHTLSNRPFAINSASQVEISLMQADEAFVHCDGQMQTELRYGDKVMVRRLERKLTLLHPNGHSHYAMLREKLNWG